MKDYIAFVKAHPLFASALTLIAGFGIGLLFCLFI